MPTDNAQAIRDWAKASRTKPKPSLRRHIALDLDDVCLDFTGGLRAAVAREFGIEVPPFSAWEIRDVLDPIIGESWWAWMRKRDWLWKTFPAVEGAIGTIMQLRRDGYYLEIVTSKPEWAEASVWQWLGRWRPAVHRVTIVDDKQRKVDWTEAQVLVDDKVAGCQHWIDEYRNAILFQRPHNESDLTIHPRLYHASNWQEVRKLIHELVP